MKFDEGMIIASSTIYVCNKDERKSLFIYPVYKLFKIKVVTIVPTAYV